jgi:chromosome segregation protein
MRLEKVILDGFKSFADKTDFTFSKAKTAIVGPNGCGKSNVVDAVKWVLGEQSAKSLRSGQMADVIFGGSSSRKPLGSAQVTLVIGDTQGKLPVETDQVQISRRVYKSGESEYRINNKSCRLKDIKELFMNTGVGSKAYSIIEQGQVERLLNSSKQERRIIFEEAAGISKYKAHKKEASRKLERTEQNLLRLADVLGEVQKQLRSVKMQAGKARNFLQYKERLKELQLNYSLVEYDNIQQKIQSKQESLNRLEEDFTEISTLVSRNDASVSNLSQKILDTESEINGVDNSLVSIKSEIDQLLQKIEFHREKQKELSERTANACEKIKSSKRDNSLLEKQLEEYKQQQQKAQQQLSGKQDDLESAETESREASSEYSRIQTELEDEKSGIIDIVRRTAQLHNEVRSISVYRDNLSNQKDRLSSKSSSDKQEIEKLLTEKAQQNERLADIDKILEQLRQNLDEKTEKIEQLEEDIAKSNTELANKKENKSALSRELTVLSDMQNRHEGMNKAVKTIMQKRSSQQECFEYVKGMLADIIEADMEYAKALEAALDNKASIFVVDNYENLLANKSDIDNLQGAVEFIGLHNIAPFVDNTNLTGCEGVKGRLVEFVTYPPEYSPLVWKLLGKTIVVDSIESAARLYDKFGGEFSFVTLKGESFNRNSVIKLGKSSKNTGLISRKSRQRQLQEQIDKIGDEIAGLEEKVCDDTNQKKHLDKLCKELRTSIYEANTEKTQVHSKLSFCEQNIEKLRKEQPIIDQEKDKLEKQISESVKNEYNSKQKLEELETVNQQRKEHIEQLEKDLSRKSEQLKAKNEELTNLKIEVGQITEQNKSIKQTIENLERQITESRKAVKNSQEEIDYCKRQSQQIHHQILTDEARISELFVAKEDKQNESRKLHDKVNELSCQREETERHIREKREERDRLEEKINNLKIELGQLQVKQDDLAERVNEELQIDLAESYKDYQKDEDIDWEGVKEEISELKGKIERLGNVNVEAIEQQDELEERNEFLTKQVDDLNKSKQQLQQLITNLNNKSREKFKEVFETIRKNFQEIFRKLFGGGKADIYLEQDEEIEDILDAGIEIVAKPPGKETRNLSLLSGGEKSMTAIALLFAVFKAKPSPFCMLDEVDAALDEANIERFNVLIKEFEKDSQFIMITHSKRTMSMADMLYGVTMQTRGISKKISVEFEEFEGNEDEKAA